jgi:hypothetical protein
VLAAALAAGMALFSVSCTDPAPVLTPGVPVVPAPAGGGVVAPFPDVVSTPGARTVTKRYGPYTVPAAKGTAHGQEGMLTQTVPGIAKPCTNCYLTGMHTVLRYPDGREANIDTGQWLHHTIFFSWPQTDSTCPAQGLGLLGERFFATGNERSPVRFPAGFGYKVGGFDSWSIIFDLMNSTTAASNVQIETTYEWVPASTPGMTALRPVWIDATKHCIFSGLPAQVGQYSYTTEWTVDRPGRVIGVGGHMHDGATHYELTNATTGELICRGVAGYGGPGFEEPGDPGGHEHDAGGGEHASEHLSSLHECVAPSGDKPVARIANGQKVRFVVYYDTARHPQKGTHPVMGVSLVYVAP